MLIYRKNHGAPSKSECPNTHSKIKTKIFMKQMTNLCKVVVHEVEFAKKPRWHDGNLWWPDMHGNTVNRLYGDRIETVCEVPTGPSAIGWLCVCSG